MAQAEVDDGEVAGAVGCDRTTISRIRRGLVAPSALVRIRIDRWADGVRFRKRWPARCRLSWDHLLADTDRGDRAASSAG